MSTQFKSLFKSGECIKKDIISDFANELLSEAKKLADKYGKEEYLEMVKNKQ